MNTDTETIFFNTYMCTHCIFWHYTSLIWKGAQISNSQKARSTERKNIQQKDNPKGRIWECNGEPINFIKFFS